jgi:hypothetical protein
VLWALFEAAWVLYTSKKFLATGNLLKMSNKIQFKSRIENGIATEIGCSLLEYFLLWVLLDTNNLGILFNIILHKVHRSASSLF